MEYIGDASKLTDLPKIEEMGLSKKKVARSVAEVFAAQIFDMGFVQADGHPRCATPFTVGDMPPTHLMFHC
jgi:predicted unusual protein kinase regulating ubiquinone biosynthesis (AarF/ABC1/UbiB family)